ncbi:Calsyntenin-1 [Eumeta japonica]|uniref:Calsyntenin-1 n=1 Tax=Eumeta variegata TaxID=151549 RepID=A0A4C1WUD2_EUMVA|nr:Calsyntenin-1 [Eumeta japonica]
MEGEWSGDEVVCHRNSHSMDEINTGSYYFTSVLCVIRNTEPLEYEKWHNHILSVVAYDCGMKRSEPVMVTITVNKPCRAGWKGIAERVDYAPGTGPLALFPAARLAACSSDERCPGVTRIQAVVSLQASRAGTGCDRDTYSLHSQRTICGLNQNTIDLLPGPGAGNEWAKALKPDSGHDGEHMFEFDGETTSAVVPEAVLAHSLGSTFSISTWMRHAPRPDNDKHRKEHILCLADDHSTYSLHKILYRSAPRDRLVVHFAQPRSVTNLHSLLALRCDTTAPALPVWPCNY